MHRKLTLAILIICLATAVAGAQSAPPSHGILFDPQKFAEAHIRGLDRQMHLSVQQKEKIRPVFFAEGQRLIAILKDPRLSQEQRQHYIQQLHQETAARVFTMLTPEQRNRPEEHRRNEAPAHPKQPAQPGSPAII